MRKPRTNSSTPSTVTAGKMVRQYYVPQITEISEQELQSIFRAAKPPVCLLGGWAVHLHVNEGFQTEYGREYIGSRDIDLGIHIQPDQTSEEIRESVVGKHWKQSRNSGTAEADSASYKPFTETTTADSPRKKPGNYPSTSSSKSTSTSSPTPQNWLSSTTHSDSHRQQNHFSNLSSKTMLGYLSESSFPGPCLRRYRSFRPNSWLR